VALLWWTARILLSVTPPPLPTVSFVGQRMDSYWAREAQHAPSSSPSHFLRCACNSWCTGEFPSLAPIEVLEVALAKSLVTMLGEDKWDDLPRMDRPVRGYAVIVPPPLPPARFAHPCTCPTLTRLTHACARFA
jgi:hypothetical protein